jgi:hypothetical protein
MSCDDAGDGDVFVYLFPSKRVAVELEAYFFQLCIRGLAQKSKSVCRKANDAAIGKLNKNGALFGPRAQRNGLDFADGGLIGGRGTHDSWKVTSFDVQNKPLDGA